MNDFLDGRVRVVVGDITREAVDAVVNAANSTLLGGGGVDGAIHDAGGPAILAACRELRRTSYPEGLPTGEAAITTGGDLGVRFVIHTVGPVYGVPESAGREAELLANCYRHALQLAAAHELETVAFPAISTGAYGYPRHEAAIVASRAIKSFLLGGNEAAAMPAEQATCVIREVRLVFFSAANAAEFLQHQHFE